MFDYRLRSLAVSREAGGLGVDMAEGAAKTLGLYIHSIAFKESYLLQINNRFQIFGLIVLLFIYY